MGFSRQEYWSELPCPSPGDLPDSGIEPGSPALQADSLLSESPPKTHVVRGHLLYSIRKGREGGKEVGGRVRHSRYSGTHVRSPEYDLQALILTSLLSAALESQGAQKCSSDLSPDELEPTIR